MRRLAILRPEPGATATAEAARRLGLQPVLIPLFHIQPLPWSAPDPAGFDGLLVTSANALRCGGPELRKLEGLPVHAVGEATAAEARKMGLSVETVGTGGVDALLSTLPPNVNLLHLCGAERREPRSHSQAISTLAVYRSAELPLPANFRSVESSIVAVHSLRAGGRLAKLAQEAGIACKTVSVVAISPEAAKAVGVDWQHVEAAEEPNEQALLALAARLCQNPAQ